MPGIQAMHASGHFRKAGRLYTQQATSNVRTCGDLRILYYWQKSQHEGHAAASRQLNAKEAPPYRCTRSQRRPWCPQWYSWYDTAGRGAWQHSSCRLLTTCREHSPRTSGQSRPVSAQIRGSRRLLLFWGWGGERTLHQPLMSGYRCLPGLLVM